MWSYGQVFNLIFLLLPIHHLSPFSSPVFPSLFLSFGFDLFFPTFPNFPPYSQSCPSITFTSLSFLSFSPVFFFIPTHLLLSFPCRCFKQVRNLGRNSVCQMRRKWEQGFLGISGTKIKIWSTKFHAVLVDSGNRWQAERVPPQECRTVFRLSLKVLQCRCG